VETIQLASKMDNTTTVTEIKEIEQRLKSAMNGKASEAAIGAILSDLPLAITQDHVHSSDIVGTVLAAKKYGDRGGVLYAAAKGVLKKWKRALSWTRFNALPTKRMKGAELLNHAINELRISCEIEAAVNDVFDASSEVDHKAYADKIRSLATNLRQNARLRHDVVSGALSADELVQMTVGELATDEQKEEKTRALQTDIAERIVTEPELPPIKEFERA